MIIKPSDRLADVKSYYFATKLAEIAEMNSSGEQVINLGIGSPDLLPPDQVIESLRQCALEERSNMYQSYKGIPPLRAAFSAHYKKYMQMDIDPETEVLPLIGSKEGIMHISMSFLNPGDEVLVPNPGYPSYATTAELAGARPVYFDLKKENGWLPDLKSLANKNLSRVKLMWINYPNMPTGATLDRASMQAIVDFALQNDILLCHDNPYNMILNDSPQSILSCTDAKKCCLELYSLSKGFNMAGWRVGAVLGAKDYIDTIMRFKSNMDSGMYKPIQEAASVALQLGADWFEHLNKIYTDRREKVYQIFDLLDCTYSRDGAGLFVWAEVPSYLADVESWVDEILQQARVFITPGFIFGSNGQRYVRISLCADATQYAVAQRRLEERFIKTIA